MKISFSVDTKPYSQPRPRVVHGHAFEPKNVAEYKQTIAIVGRAAMRGRPLFSSSCAVAVTIRRNIDICSRNFGDVDNHVKAVLDAINGVCYTDDRLVVSVIAIKIKSAVEGVDVIVADSLLDILSNLKEEPS